MSKHNSSKTFLRILYLGSNDNQLDLLKSLTKESKVYQVQVKSISLVEENKLSFEKDDIDIIFLDQGDKINNQDMGLLRQIRDFNAKIPIIVIIDKGSEDGAVEMIKNGALDYLTRGKYSLEILERVFAYVIKRQALAFEKEKSEKKLLQMATVIEQAAESIMITDLSGHIEYVNPVFEQVTGYTASEVIGKHPNKLSSGYQSEEFYRDLWDTITSGQVWKGKFINKRKDGSLFYEQATIFPIKDESKRITNYAAVKRDITEQVQAEKALTESEYKYRMIFDLSPEAIVILDEQGVVLDINGRVYDWLGYEPQEIIAQNFLSLLFLTEESKDMAKEQFYLTMEKGEKVPYELDFITKSGERRIGRLMARPIYNSEGQAAQDLVMISDVTDLRQAWESLQQAKDEAERANKAKSEFLANMSHEIRTPMNAILGMGQLLEKSGLNAEQMEYAKVIRSSVEGLVRVINDILDVSKIESNRLEIEENLVNFSELIEELISLMQIQAKEKQIDLEYELYGQLPYLVRTDGVRLKQIITNLLNNAIKFTHSGKVVFKVESLGVIIDNQVVDISFTVLDTGIGISNEKQQVIFDSFVQVDGSSSREYEGTGLGLTISNRLIQLMGGTGISVQSQLGQGSRFSFVLPFLVIQSSPSYDLGRSSESNILSQEERQSKLQEVSVMVAEDNSVNKLLLQKIFEKIGLEKVKFASTGQEVLDKILDYPQQWDIVFMDIQMPVMDGLEATRHIREAGLKLPIIALTAHAMQDDRDRCQQAGMNDYVTKPYKVEVLKKILLNYFG